MRDIAIKVERQLFSILNEQDWKDNALSQYQRCGIQQDYLLTVDALGHIVSISKGFGQLPSQASYPITVYKFTPIWGRP